MWAIIPWWQFHLHASVFVKRAPWWDATPAVSPCLWTRLSVYPQRVVLAESGFPSLSQPGVWIEAGALVHLCFVHDMWSASSLLTNSCPLFPAWVWSWIYFFILEFHYIYRLKWGDFISIYSWVVPFRNNVYLHLFKFHWFFTNIL